MLCSCSSPERQLLCSCSTFKGATAQTTTLPANLTQTAIAPVYRPAIAPGNIALSTVRTARSIAINPVCRVSSMTTSKIDMLLELDSHADTCVLGRNALVILDYQKIVHVTGFNPLLGTVPYRLVSGVVGYFHPHTHRRYHLVIHQAIHVPTLEYNLLNPNQLRVNGVTLNHVPKFLLTNPSEDDRTLIVADPENVSVTLSLPLMLRGIVSLPGD